MVWRGPTVVEPITGRPLARRPAATHREVGVHDDASDVRVWRPCAGHLAPLAIRVCERGLHHVLRVVRVAGQDVREPEQCRPAGGGVLLELHARSRPWRSLMHEMREQPRSAARAWEVAGTSLTRDPAGPGGQPELAARRSARRLLSLPWPACRSRPQPGWDGRRWSAITGLTLASFLGLRASRPPLFLFAIEVAPPGRETCDVSRQPLECPTLGRSPAERETAFPRPPWRDPLGPVCRPSGRVRRVASGSATVAA